MSLPVKNKHGADIVAAEMDTLNNNNINLQTTTTSSVDMTSDISSQVQHIAVMIEEMVKLIDESRHSRPEQLRGSEQSASDYKDYVRAFLRYRANASGI